MLILVFLVHAVSDYVSWDGAQTAILVCCCMCNDSLAVVPPMVWQPCFLILCAGLQRVSQFLRCFRHLLVYLSDGSDTPLFSTFPCEILLYRQENALFTLFTDVLEPEGELSAYAM